MTAFWSASLIDLTGFELLEARKIGCLELGFVLTHGHGILQVAP